ncbi:phage virion morphogenesis protein [Bacillus cereus group sp. IBL03679]|uniref:phage virion morphogenesis protein n=1 Tax=Bacillus cereus group sp. IBL03679 TaxID=3240095 RepID=UPI003D2F89DB
MPGVDYRVTVRPNGTDLRLRNIGNRLKDLRTPMTRSATYMERSVGNRFRAAPWVPLSENTIKWHPNRAGGKPLNDTGQLKMSVTGGAIKRIDKLEMYFGTALPKAKLHNFGGRTKFGYVPARKFLYFDTQDESMIKRIFQDYIEELVD